MIIKFKESFCTVFTENGVHKLMLPDKTVIPHQVKSIVENDVYSSKATIEVAVNLTSTKEEAIKLYDENKSIGYK